MKLLQVIFCSVCICLSPDGYKKNRSSIICYAWVLWNENDPTFWFNAPTFSPFVCYAPLSFLSVNGSCFTSYIYLCYISFLFIKMQFNLKTVFYLLLQKLWKVCWLHQWVSRKWTLDKKKKNRKCKCLFIHHRWIQRNAGLVITCVLCSASAFKSQMYAQSKFGHNCWCSYERICSGVLIC